MKRFLPLCCLILIPACFQPIPSHLRIAEDFRAQGKYTEAIDEYKRFIELRLRKPDLPKEQNPYFYYLLIGDTYLQLNNPQAAKEAYLFAKEHDAGSELVAGKLRYLGHWFEEHGNEEAAMNIFHEFRELDPLLYDIDIDRLHKKMLEEEDSKHLPSSK